MGNIIVFIIVITSNTMYLNIYMKKIILSKNMRFLRQDLWGSLTAEIMRWTKTSHYFHNITIF